MPPNTLIDRILERLPFTTIGQQIMEEDARAVAEQRARWGAELRALEQDRDAKLPALDKALAAAKKKLDAAQEVFDAAKAVHNEAYAARRSHVASAESQITRVRARLHETAPGIITSTEQELLDLADAIRKRGVSGEYGDPVMGWSGTMQKLVRTNRYAIDRRLTAIMAAVHEVRDLKETYLEDPVPALEAIKAKIPGGMAVETALEPFDANAAA